MRAQYKNTIINRGSSTSTARINTDISTVCFCQVYALLFIVDVCVRKYTCSYIWTFAKDAGAKCHRNNRWLNAKTLIGVYRATMLSQCLNIPVPDIQYLNTALTTNRNLISHLNCRSHFYAFPQ